MKFIYLALLMGCACLLPAQNRKPSPPGTSSRLLSVNPTGSRRYLPQQIVAATRLQLGQSVSDEDFKSVSRHLGECGAFSNVAYTFQFSPAGIKLTLQLTDNEQFVPVRFENFVWLSDQDLQARLRDNVPLFQGQLPLTGDLVDQVSDALQTLAIEHNLKGKVDYLRAGPLDGPVESFVFTVTGQEVRVRKIEFPGAGESELPALASAAKNLAGQEYIRTSLKIQAEKTFLPIYLDRGYLKAAFSDAQPKIVEETPEATLVDVDFTVSPGQQYKLEELQMAGYKLFPVEKLQGLIHLQPGQPASAIKLSDDIEAIKQLYRSLGFMAIQIVTTSDLNDTAATVKYLLQFQEGGVYKMGDLEIRGLDSRTTESVAAAWKLREGDTYNSQYPKQFMESAKNLLRGDDWSIAVHESVEEKDKVVDVSLHFERKP